MLATIALGLIVASIIISSYYVILGNKYLKLTICILNSLVPIIILLSFVFAKIQYWNAMGLLLVLIYGAINVCQYVIKPLRLFPLVQVTEKAAS